jgi:Flp pilus assembly protein TadD
MQTIRRPCIALVFVLCATAAHAADDPPSPPPARSSAAPAPVDPLASPRALIAQERWRDAIAELRKANLTDNADWHNLMGYSHRKAKTPDYAAANFHYDAALRLQPQHRGALEYSGELYLMQGDVARAKSRLAHLEAACGTGCAEYKQLQSAIAAHTATQDGGPKK